MRWLLDLHARLQQPIALTCSGALSPALTYTACGMLIQYATLRIFAHDNCLQERLGCSHLAAS